MVKTKLKPQKQRRLKTNNPTPFDLPSESEPRFTVNPDPDPIIEYALSCLGVMKGPIGLHISHVLQTHFSAFLPPPRRLCFRRCLSVCLLATLRKNFRTDLHEIFREGCQWADEQIVKFWWRSRSPSACMDCFPDSSLLGHTESGINRLR